MRIYTRKGDDGTTGRSSGGRVPKHDPRVAAVGVMDEFNAQLGVCRSQIAAADQMASVIEGAQAELFSLGALLAGGEARAASDVDPVAALEHDIDRMEAELPALTSFILPGGGPLGASLHMARTVCRRAERSISAARATFPDMADAGQEALRYLNRLSDWLFVAARFANHGEGRAETPWKPA